MSQMERVFAIDRQLRRRVPPTKTDLIHRLEVSSATLKRDLEFMRGRLHAPIVWDRMTGGYRYQKPEEGQAEFELPGLWFSPGELHALLLMRHLLRQLEPGFLSEQLKPLERRLDELTEDCRTNTDRILLRATPLRPVNPEHFEQVATATMKRKQLNITYFGRHRNGISERIISPQRLVYYRGSWYLDAWCHTREDCRRFALDSIRAIKLLSTNSVDIDPDSQSDAYGIFTGKEARTAILRFDPEASRWVADEEWHPRQTRTMLEDGSLILRVPFGHPQELLMDVLRHGKHVEVITPGDLREAVINGLEEARAVYARPGRRFPQSAANRDVKRAHAG
jgi:predicted DNA-binding transcriptional regulator YafY